MLEKEFHLKDNTACRIFILGIIIVLKLLLMGLFSSDYQDIMFIPFVSNFLKGQNPYQFYYENQLLSSFPYFPLMLLIESAGGTLLKWVSPDGIFWRNLIFKLPLLAFDLLGYYFIRKLNVRFKYAVLFYFCSPIVLYAIYMHGQLDIIPTVFLIIAIYHLLNWRNQYSLYWYAVFLGLALSTKLHILAAVPVLFFYVTKKKGYMPAVKCLLITGLTIGIFVFGFWGRGFVETVLFNKEQSILLQVSLDYGTARILIPVLVLLVLYLNIYELNYFNRNLLISILGLLFSVFLICIPPMPAWYVWMVPFVALYFGFAREDKYKTMLVYAALNLIYVFYFICLHRTEYVDLYFLGSSLQKFKISNTAAKDIVFTLMAACFVMIIFKMYRFGIASNQLYRRRNVPFTIGIAGDSGAGKSELLEKIEHLFGTDRDILFMEGDGYHRWERNDDNWGKYTSLNPQANYLYQQVKDLRILKEGGHVDRKDYNHDSGTFVLLKNIRPKKYIILCGLHSLYLPQLRRELDLKIYMDTDQRLCRFWKIRRDVTVRGYSLTRTLEQIERRLPDAEKYVYPQKEYADLVITYFDKTLSDYMDARHDVTLSVKFQVDINLDLEKLIQCFQDYSIYPQQVFCDDLVHQELIFDGLELKGKAVDFAGLAETVIPQYEDLFTYSPDWGKGVEGVVQLFLLFMISENMRGA